MDIAAQLSPDCLALIVQAVRASFAAESTPISLSQSTSLRTSVAVADTSGSLLPVTGGFPSQDLSAQASALLASGTGFSLQSSLASTLFCQGRPAFVVLSFISTFASPNPSLASSQASLVAALPLSLVCPLLLLLIQCQSFINHLWSAQDSRRSQQKSSPRLCLENSWGLTSFCLPKLCSWSPKRSYCLMGA